MLMRWICFTGKNGFASLKPNWRGTNPEEEGINGLGWRMPRFLVQSHLLPVTFKSLGLLGRRKWVKDLTSGHWKCSSELPTMRGRKIHLFGLKTEKVKRRSPSLVALQSQPLGLLPGVYLLPVARNTSLWLEPDTIQPPGHFPAFAPPK